MSARGVGAFIWSLLLCQLPLMVQPSCATAASAGTQTHTHTYKLHTPTHTTNTETEGEQAARQTGGRTEGKAHHHGLL